jgi:hypothetical protein
MRALLQALAVAGALMVNTVALPAAAADAPTVSNSEPPPGTAPTPVSKADLRKASSRVHRAYRKDVPCRDVARCAVYFETFGAALTFNDGTIAPFAHEQRLERSGRGCIQEARAALSRDDRAMAVQWAMAAYIDDPLTRNWLADHPDAVLESLRHFGD